MIAVAKTEAQARRLTRIERDKHVPEARALYTVILPAGWCFEPSRHMQVEPTKAEAMRIKDKEPIEPCAHDCTCHEQEEDVS
jgi:hypothetical protein